MDSGLIVRRNRAAGRPFSSGNLSGKRSPEASFISGSATPFNMAWKSIVSQSRVKTLLTGILASKRVAHAYLFPGPEGSGQDSPAIAVATALLAGRAGTE